MTCPWCDFTAGPRGLHAHLAEAHGGAVKTAERNGKVLYEITCPRCDARYQHVVRKGARNREFITEFEREIQMVALDMLVHHLMAEHEQHEQQRTGE